jgi:small subunit ribosomal protein S13
MELEKEKKLKVSLMKIYGISYKKSKDISIYIGVKENTKIKNIPIHKLEVLKRVLTHLRQLENGLSISKNLYKYNRDQIERKIKINTLSGRRIKLGLPSRGQRTRSNGNRKNNKIKKSLLN